MPMFHACPTHDTCILSRRACPLHAKHPAKRTSSYAFLCLLIDEEDAMSACCRDSS